MANPKHVEILKSGVEAWNKWREENPDEVPDLEGADLSGVNLERVNFRKANLQQADLRKVNLREAKLRDANLSRANLCEADLDDAVLFRANISNADLSKVALYGAYLCDANLSGANLSEADLSGADLSGANLREANFHEAILFKANLESVDLREADLSGADLQRASLVGTILRGTKLDGCRIYGISVWDVSLDNHTSQRNLIITRWNHDTVTVDDLKVAQFIYLLLNNEEIRRVIDTITSKVVLILGRFTDERKQVLDAIRDELRKRDYLPVLFDFDKPSSRDLTETISTLAHMALFVIADITDAKAIPQELQKIVPSLPSLPVRPIILDSQFEYGMFQDFGGYVSVLPPYRYQDTDHLLESLEDQVIGPALTKAEEIAERRRAFEAKVGKRQ